MLSLERARFLFDYDPILGTLTRRVTTSPRARAGDVVLSRTSNGYLKVSVDYRSYLVHRVCWLIHHGRWPEGVIDHENEDGTNNRLTNMRDTGRMANAHNVTLAHADSKTGILGVSEIKQSGIYRARIMVNGKSKEVGRSRDPLAVEKLYLAAKQRLHDLPISRTIQQ